jgi:hypothetical protein
VFFLWNKSHTEPKHQKKKSAAQEAKAPVKECKGQQWTPTKSSNGKSNNQESSNFAQFQMFSQYEEYQKFQKWQKTAAGKRNRNSDNNYNASETWQLQYFKHNVLGEKGQKSIPTTEILGEVTINGVKKPISVSLLPLPQPRTCAHTDAHIFQHTQRATQLRGALALVFCVTV